MAASTVTERYSATPEAAWDLLGDFVGIGRTFPDVTDVQLEGDDRIFSMMGMRITERLVARDEATRSLTYSIVDGVPIESHEATIRIEPVDGGCEVSWTVSSVPEDAQPLFADTYQRALASLHATLDAG